MRRTAISLVIACLVSIAGMVSMAETAAGAVCPLDDPATAAATASTAARVFVGTVTDTNTGLRGYLWWVRKGERLAKIRVTEAIKGMAKKVEVLDCPKRADGGCGAGAVTLQRGPVLVVSAADPDPCLAFYVQGSAVAPLADALRAAQPPGGAGTVANSADRLPVPRGIFVWPIVAMVVVAAAAAVLGIGRALRRSPRSPRRAPV